MKFFKVTEKEYRSRSVKGRSSGLLKFNDSKLKKKKKKSHFELSQVTSFNLSLSSLTNLTAAVLWKYISKDASKKHIRYILYDGIYNI